MSKIKKLNAIKIDAATRTVTAISMYDTLDAMQAVVGGLICLGGEIPAPRGADTVYVDDEGLFKGPQHFFVIDGVTLQPLCGNALVIGTTRGGNNRDVHTTVKAIQKNIRWMSAADAAHFIPPTEIIMFDSMDDLIKAKRGPKRDDLT